MAKLGDGLPVELRIVRTRPLFVMRLDVKGPLVIGMTSNGFRRFGIAEFATGRATPRFRCSRCCILPPSDATNSAAMRTAEITENRPP
jgi:hypothetical protein